LLQELLDHINNKFNEILKRRFTGNLFSRIHSVENNMIGVLICLSLRMRSGAFTQLFVTNGADKLNTSLQFRDTFTMNVNVDCNALAADFREDLSFRFVDGVVEITPIMSDRFSLGLTNIIRRTHWLMQSMLADRRPAASDDQGKREEMGVVRVHGSTHTLCTRTGVTYGA
jgi:hypothetical protein